MHPEIKKFWEDTGHKLIGPSVIGTWKISIFKGPGPIHLIEAVCHGNRYRLNNEWYSEEKMLRFVRLKAFL